MPARRLTPQEKKRYSYARDRRNDFGGNDKAARRAVPRHKRQVNRSYRRATRMATHGWDPELIDDRTAAVVRDAWSKWRDAPLGEAVRARLEAREDRAGRRVPIRRYVLTASECPPLAELIAAGSVPEGAGLLVTEYRYANEVQLVTSRRS